MRENSRAPILTKMNFGLYLWGERGFEEGRREDRRERGKEWEMEGRRERGKKGRRERKEEKRSNGIECEDTRIIDK